MVNQYELEELIELLRAEAWHNAVQGRLRQLAFESAEAEEGRYTAVIFPEPVDRWSEKAVASVVGPEEAARIKESLPVRKYEILLMPQVRLTRKELVLVQSPTWITQRMIARFLELVGDCRELKERRRGIVQRMRAGEIVEDGQYVPDLSQREKVYWSRDAVCSVVDQDTAMRLTTNLAPQIWKRLKIFDALTGQYVGWHADAEQCPGGEVQQADICSADTSAVQLSAPDCGTPHQRCDLEMLKRHLEFAQDRWELPSADLDYRDDPQGPSPEEMVAWLSSFLG